MFNILSAVYRDDPFCYRTTVDLESPKTQAERCMAGQLAMLPPEVMRGLDDCLNTLIQEQAESAFCQGAQFGARLMAQLLEAR